MKILANLPINRDAFRNNMRSLWKIQDSASIENLGVNIFAVTGIRKEEKMRIAMEGPWHFNNYLIVMEEPSGLGEVSDLKLNKATFWVQFYNLLVYCMNKEVVLFLGRQVGVVEEIDADEAGHCVGKYVRMRIKVDVSKPLKRAVRLNTELSVKPILIWLRNEKLL